MTPATRTLSTAEDRRESVLVAAEHAFARRGYHGTPTTEVAKLAGISQAYLFRLFPTKLELFVSLVERCFARTARTFDAAGSAARAAGEEPLAAMGKAYDDLVENRDVLLVQLHAHAATDELEVRDAVRRGFRELHAVVRRQSGATDAEIQAWFAHGMLINVMSAMRADELDEPWARTLCSWSED